MAASHRPLRRTRSERDVTDALVLHTFVLALGLAATFLDRAAARRAVHLSVDGRAWRSLSAALAYANVAFSGAVSICMLNLLGSAVRGTGNMGLPAGVIVGSVLAHVVISPLLIFGWGPLPGAWPGRRRLGPDAAVRRRRPGAALYLHRAARSSGWRFAACPAVGSVRRNPQGRRAGLGQRGHHQPLGRAADRHRRPSGTRGRHRLRDGRAARIHPDPAGVRLRHRDPRHGRHQLGRPPVSPRRTIAWTGGATVSRPARRSA